MINIEERREYSFALHHLGFRPFFLLAGVFGVLSVALWYWLYHIDARLLPAGPLDMFRWHAHEMIFGYALAVIAGFLLTAVRNWTGAPTLHGVPLLVLALLWLGARCLPFVEQDWALRAMVLCDLMFGLGLLLAVWQPIAKVRQWKQLPVCVVLLVLLAANAVFYLGLFGRLDDGTRLGIQGGLFTVVFLILLMGRRVIPFFIEKGVDGGASLYNNILVDAGVLLSAFALLIAVLLDIEPRYMVLLAGILFALNALRLYWWYHGGIWRKPLLWVLYLAYAWLNLGFALLVFSGIGILNSTLAIHALAYGGVGMMTLGMMARVALGHTGRDVFAPPPVLRWMFLLLAVGALARVVLPMPWPNLYTIWVGGSQILWLGAFALFVWVYTPMLIKGRVDGRYG